MRVQLRRRTFALGKQGGSETMGEWRFDGIAGRPSTWALAALIGSIAVLALGVVLLMTLPIV